MVKNTLPFEEWPEKLQADWQLAVQSGNFLEDAGAIAHWKASTQKSTKYAVGHFLGQEFRHPWHLLSLPELALDDRIDFWILRLSKTHSARSIATMLGKLQLVCNAIYPQHNWSYLKNRHRHFEKEAEPSIKAHRMVPAHALLELGYKLMKNVHHLPPKEQPVIFRDGLMIALLASRPIRRRNLAAIRIGTHLVNRNEQWHLQFSKEETKNRRHLAFPWPTHLVHYLEVYLEKYRPKFPCADEHDGLWASYKKGALKSEGVYDRVVLHTKAEFGHSVNPHLFRDCAATTLVTEKPEQALAAKNLLGHAKLETTEKYYLQGQTLDGVRQYQQLLAHL